MLFGLSTRDLRLPSTPTTPPRLLLVYRRCARCTLNCLRCPTEAAFALAPVLIASSRRQLADKPASMALFCHQTHAMTLLMKKKCLYQRLNCVVRRTTWMRACKLKAKPVAIRGSSASNSNSNNSNNNSNPMGVTQTMKNSSLSNT